MQVWRICKERYSAAAFSGEGARLFEGRWNPAGVPMVYTSTSLALAAIETFVHLDPSVAPSDLVYVEAEVPDAPIPVERLDIRVLPRIWRRSAQKQCQKFGAEWAHSGRSLALMVPSAALEGEWNVLLNPKHADFSKVKVHKPRAFRFDERMFR